MQLFYNTYYTMQLISQIKSNIKAIFSITLLIAAVIYREEIEIWYNSVRQGSPPKSIPGVFTQDQLASYNGVVKKKLYLSVLGTVIDVSKGRNHYEKGSSYNYFVGKDGSRALVTGNFNDESKSKDHVLDLSCDELDAVLQWRNTFTAKYKAVGILIGRYYNEKGEETSYMKQVDDKLDDCKIKKDLEKLEDTKFPHCNMAWDAEQGSRVWCSNNSGGVTRSWVGVPRQLFTPGQDKPRCACVNLNDISGALLKEYENCTPTSTSCNLGNS